MAEPGGTGSGWEAHEREQRLAWLALTPRQRLDWLWEAKLFARRVEEARLRAASGPLGDVEGTSTPGT